MRTIMTIILTCGLLILAATAYPQDSVIVNISPVVCPYADSHLAERLEYKLSTLNRLPLAVHKDAVLPEKFENLNQIVDRGQTQKARFLVDIYVDKLDLAKRKITVVPLAVYRYQVYAVISGHIRIIDVVKKRVVKMNRFQWESKGSDQWQLIDDEPDDPALNLPADEKIILFDSLEEKAAEGLFEQIKIDTRGNHFDTQK
ncbi:hypothetical protein TRIP_C60519 [Candidatus Zixiibacteriota bacterium]|nr:hypothetical protein TRIP_C60519 [candidate division Zixibacteria bacterium]